MSNRLKIKSLKYIATERRLLRTSLLLLFSYLYIIHLISLPPPSKYTVFIKSCILKPCTFFPNWLFVKAFMSSMSSMSSVSTLPTGNKWQRNRRRYDIFFLCPPPPPQPRNPISVPEKLERGGPCWLLNWGDWGLKRRTNEKGLCLGCFSRPSTK